MKILVIGSGGREHALAWKCAQSAGVSEVIVAPGNAGTALEDRIRNVDIAAGDIEGLIALATNERVALTIVGPEQPLVAGIADMSERLVDVGKGLIIRGRDAVPLQEVLGKRFRSFQLRRLGARAEAGRFPGRPFGN